MSDFVTVASHATEVEAELTVALLGAWGIAAHVVRDNAGGMLPNLDPRRGVRVVVAAADADEARAVLEEDG
ncbi:MAG TPA: DUF2007 domain-containing protein [Gemmatimonadales bacterium]|nr:DUF2007 domain-containing protein [Gemmatimonadales bacterium]